MTYTAFLLNNLTTIVQQAPLSFHTPGHKNGRLLPTALKERWGDAFARYDLTEIDTLDNLHFATGCIAQSQQQAADIWQAAATYYLVNGTSGGLQAAIMATCHQAQVFVPRHVHRSVYHSLLLADAQPIYLPITLDPQSGLPLGVAVDTLAEYLARYPQCRNLLLVNPTYQGITWQNVACVQLAKARGLTVIVDEAHGSHLHFSSQLPPSLLDQGADLVVQSWHKTLPVLTQGSALHVHANYHGPAIAKFLSLLQTTSPSYLTMASLEAGSMMMGEQGHTMITASLTQLATFHQWMAENLSTIHRLYDPQWQQDVFKLYLCSDKISGAALADQLQKQFHMYSEMSDSNGCLLLLPLAIDAALIAALQVALTSIDDASASLPARSPAATFYCQTIPTQVLSLAEAFRQPQIDCTWADAPGKIAGEFIIKYPPGIPLVAPGERITDTMATQWLATGGQLTDHLWIIDEN